MRYTEPMIKDPRMSPQDREQFAHLRATLPESCRRLIDARMHEVAIVNRTLGVAAGYQTGARRNRSWIVAVGALGFVSGLAVGHWL